MALRPDLSIGLPFRAVTYSMQSMCTFYAERQRSTLVTVACRFLERHAHIRFRFGVHATALGLAMLRKSCPIVWLRARLIERQMPGRLERTSLAPRAFDDPRLVARWLHPEQQTPDLGVATLAGSILGLGSRNQSLGVRMRIICRGALPPT